MTALKDTSTHLTL